MEIAAEDRKEIIPFYIIITKDVRKFIKYLLKGYIINSIMVRGLYNSIKADKFCFNLLTIERNIKNRIKNINNKRNNYKTFFIINFANFPRRIWGLWSININNNILMTQFPKCVKTHLGNFGQILIIKNEFY